MTIEQVYPQVADIIADVLAIETDEVALDKRLIADLGAESIDFLDLVFQLERSFKVKIPRGQIETEARGSLSEAEFEQGGVITDKGLEALKQYLSEVPAEHFTPGLKVSHIGTLFTVETLCKRVVNAQAKQSTTATA
jgi:acyl carrier protein